jgi:MFS family permease
MSTMLHHPLCSLPVFLVVLVAALDSADKQLLASSFPMLEKTLHLEVATLGYFSLFTNLAYSLSLPVWGWLVHHYGIENAHNILAGACLTWGLAALGIAFAGSNIVAQAAFRSLNGAALASILPLSQTMLVEVVPIKMRGRAFGIMFLSEKVTGTIAASSIIYLDNWQRPYLIVGAFSVLMAFLVQRKLRMKPETKTHKDDDDGTEEKTLTLAQTVRRIARVPAFLFLVAQGVFGAVPWDMFAFVLLLLQWKGFSKEQIVSIQFTGGTSSMVGGALGGFLGDYFSYHPKGRIYVAFTSVAGGIVFYNFFLFTSSYRTSLLWINLFNLWGTWTTAAANRPICAEMALNRSERASIVAMWILLEKTSAAVFGAPLVGYLTSGMIRHDQEKEFESTEKARVLAFNIFTLSTFFWAACAIFWLAMAYTIDVRPKRKSSFDKVSREDEEGVA